MVHVLFLTPKAGVWVVIYKTKLERDPIVGEFKVGR